MSMISKDGYEQIKVIKAALDSMYEKLDRTVYVEASGKIRNIEEKYKSTNVFDSVKDEFEAISGIVELAGTWSEV